MKILSAIEIACVVKEIQSLVDARVNKVYQPTQHEILLALHRTGIGKTLLRIIPGQSLYIADDKLPSPKSAFNFCMFLRKRITNSRLRSIQQKDFERIVEFVFEGKEGQFRLIAEFFSRGNLILCDLDYNIISAMEVQIWKDREIKAKVKYSYPPEANVNIFSISLDEFRKVVSSSVRDSIVKTLAVDIGLGGMYSEELCLQAKVDKSSKPSGKDVERLFKEMKEMSYLNISPFYIGEDAVPFDMLFYKGAKKEPCESYNEALNRLYSQYIEIVKENPAKAKLEEQERILKSQEEQVKNMEKAVEENREKGDLIYSNYQFVKEVLGTIKSARDKKVSWEEIEEKLKAKGIIVNGRQGLVALDLK